MAQLLADFLATEIPVVSAIVGNGLLPTLGKLIIGGAPKIGKSYIVQNMAVNLALGEPIFAAHWRETGKPLFPVYGRQRVLYFDQELGPQGLQYRLRLLTNDANVPGMELYIKNRDMNLRMDLPAGQILMGKEIEQCRPTVTILDPLAKFHVSDENSAQMMGYIMRQGDKWIETFQTSLIYLHHTGHPNPQFPRTGGDRLRGSSAIFADADAVMTVELLSSRGTKEPTYKLEFDLRRGEPHDPILIKKLKNGRIVYVGTQVPSHEETLMPTRARNAPLE